MIHFDPVAAPGGFDNRARVPGNRWIASHPHMLLRGLDQLKQEKRTLRGATRLLDPRAVTDGWFEIILPSLQLTVADTVPCRVRPLAEYTIKRLRLVHDERVMRQRREWYRMYQCGELTLVGLKKKAPLIAAAVARTGP